MDEKQAIGKKGWKWDWRARKLHVLTPSYHICIFVFVFVEMRLVGGGEITWHCVLTPSYAHFLQDLWPDSHYITPHFDLDLNLDYMFLCLCLRLYISQEANFQIVFSFKERTIFQNPSIEMHLDEKRI